MSELHIHINRRVPRPELRPTRRTAFLLWLIAILGLIASPFLTALISPAIRDLNPQLQLLIGNLMYYLPFVALPVILPAVRRPGLFMAYRPNPISLFNTIIITVLAFLGVFLVNDIVVLWSIPFQKLGFDVLASTLPLPQNRAELMLCVFTVAVLPGVCEEFLFRGAILSALEDEGTKHAVWISSILFMLVHASILGAPTQLLLGIIISVMVVWTNSIYAGLIYHTVHNAASVILNYVQAHALPADEAAAVTDLWEEIGGILGAMDLALGILISGALIFFSLKMFRLRGMLMGVTAVDRKKIPLRISEILILAAGGMLCLLLYASDILTMLGG